MKSQPTRTPIWSSAAPCRNKRLANLDLAIPATYHRLTRALGETRDALEISDYANMLLEMLKTLRELHPSHPHLATYSLEKAVA